VAEKKGNHEVLHIADLAKRVSSKTPKTSGEMTSAEKKSRITQKKGLGQPAGKPRRVDALRKKKDNKEKIMAINKHT
jgi:hypothetical protein